MRPEIIDYLDREPELWEYLHQNPQWYSELSRCPEKINEIKSAANDYFGRSLNKRIERFSDYLTMLNTFFQLSILTGEPSENATPK